MYGLNSKVRILLDLHHFDLFHSFQLSLEKRFDWEIYRPIGLDWKTEGYWWMDEDPDFVQCMLSEQSGKASEILSEYETLMGKNWAVFSLHLPRIGQILNLGNGQYKVQDKSKEATWQRAITLEGFKNLKFDVIVSSLSQHYVPFQNLLQKYQPHAKHVHCISGMWQQVSPSARNILTTFPNSIGKTNHLCWKQEFDTNVFKPSATTTDNITKVRSYVHFPAAEILWDRLNLGWDFKFIGKTLGPLKDVVVKSKDLANTIATSGFTFHYKPGGESYGHILHNSFAIGRPVILNVEDFKGTAGEELLNRDTCIDISSSRTMNAIRSDLIDAAIPSRYEVIQKAVVKKFKEVVDFNREANKLKHFLENLQ